MRIPCAYKPAFIIAGLSFLQPALTNIQFQNMTMIATALILGARFNLSEINRMWLKEKSVSALSEFLSDAKFSTDEMQMLHLLEMRDACGVTGGYFPIDDTMKRHTTFCKWIHRAQLLFDHALGTNTKATCIVFLYYSDGLCLKFPLNFRIYYQKQSSTPWRKRAGFEYKTKNELALELLKWALDAGFPKCTVLADSWFGVETFVKGLRKLELSYAIEIKDTLKVRMKPKAPKLAKTGKLCKKQYDLVTLAGFFENVAETKACGFAAEKKARVLYHAKIANVRLNSIPGVNRVVESIDPQKKTTKYLITNELTWEATKIISTYGYRWVIEEFFRNAKQLSDMEGASLRSEQGVTTALCLVSWIDSLLHLENFKRSTAENAKKEPLTAQSIVRRIQCENMEAFVDRVVSDDQFVEKWFSVEKERISRKRKKTYELIDMPADGYAEYLNAA